MLNPRAAQLNVPTARPAGTHESFRAAFVVVEKLFVAGQWQAAEDG